MCPFGFFLFPQSKDKSFIGDSNVPEFCFSQSCDEPETREVTLTRVHFCSWDAENPRLESRTST